MRLLTVSHFFESHGGGIERVAGQLCREFARLGMTAAWAASDSDSIPADVETIPLRCANPTEKLSGLPMPIPGIRALRALAGEVRRSNAVVIHDALYATSIAALLIAKAHRKRTILIQHIAGIPFSSSVLRLVMRMANALVTRPMLRAADVRVFISDTVREDLLGRPPRLASELLFNGVDHAIFHPAEGEAPLPKAAENMERGAGRRVLFVGRYVEKKGLAVLRCLAEQRPDLRFYLVGAGPLRPGNWGFANVHDLGPQPSQSLADLYRWADVLLLPSVGEGYPLVIQEAMACGLPVVCGSPCERADPEAAPWLHGVAIDLSDPGASARRCSDALDNLDLSPVERAQMAEYAVQRYDWPSMARKLIELAEFPRGAALG